MKRKISLFLSLVMMVFTLAACTSDQTGLVSEFKKVNTWEACQVKETGKVSVDVGGEKVNLTIDATGVSNAKDQTANITVTIKEDKGLFNIPMSIYVDKQKVYINKGYFEALAKVAGSPVPEKLAALKEEYIVFDASAGETSDLQKELLQLSNATAGSDVIFKFLENIATDIGLDIPVVKEGDTYKVNLTSDQLVDMAKKVADTTVSNLDKLNGTLGLGLTKEEISEAVAEYNAQKADIDAALPQVKEMIKGSSFGMTFKFEDAKVNESLNLVINVPETMNTTMNLNVESVKIEPKAIEMPKSSVTLTIDQLVELF